VILELPQQSNIDRPMTDAKINNLLAEPENEGNYIYVINN